MQKFAQLSFLALFLASNQNLVAQEPYAKDRVIVRLRATPAMASGAFSASQFNSLNSNVQSVLNAVPAKSVRHLFNLPTQGSIFNPTRVSGFNLLKRQVVQSQQDRTLLIELDANTNVQDVLQTLRQHEDVELAEPDYAMTFSDTVPNDSQFDVQYGLQNTGQIGSQDSFDPSSGTSGRDIDAVRAWDTTNGSTGVVVAVIDSGLDWDHPDISANIWNNSDEAVDASDTDGNGFTDDVRGWDFGDGDNNPDDDCSNASPLLDSGGHGTHVSGIIGAVGNNSVGVSGVNWSVSVMPLKVSQSDCQIFTSAIANALTYAVNNGASVVNMSLGGSHSSTLQSAIDLADSSGLVLVAAAGNESTSDNSFSFPAAYSNVLGIVATDRNDQTASFTNFGDWVSMSAPGVAIRSLKPVPDGSYGYLSGTSMASPMVAGAAALIRSQYSLTSDQIDSRLTQSAEDIDSLNSSFTGQIGTGRLNVAYALMSVSGVSPNVGLNAGSVNVTVTGVSLLSGMTLTLTRSGETSITASNLNFLSSTQMTGTFNLVGATPGLWNVVVTASNFTQTLTDGFRVESIVLSRVEPFKAANTGPVNVTMYGENFVEGMNAHLEQNGQPNIPATNLRVVHDKTATATFDLTGVADNRWTMVITRNSATGTFPRAFAVTSNTFDVFSADPSQSHTFTLSAPQGDHSLMVPAGAFRDEINFDFDAIPSLSGIDQSKDPYAPTGVGAEITGNEPTLHFLLPITLRLSYRLNDLPDPNNEDALTMAYFNTTTNRWHPIASIIDKVNRTVTASFSHLTEFALVQHIPSINLNSTIAFPNPFRSKQGHTRVIFDFLTAGSRIRVYDVSGELIRDLSDNNNDGQIIWPVDTEDGNPVASGVYYFMATDNSGNKKIGRVGVIR